MIKNYCEAINNSFFLAAALSAAFRTLCLFIQFEITVVRVPASRVIADLISS